MGFRGFAPVAAIMATFAATTAHADDSAPQQGGWGDVPYARLQPPHPLHPPHAHVDRRDGFAGDHVPPPYDPYFPYDGVTGGVAGTREGTWEGRYDDGRPYRYTGSFDGEYRSAGAPYPRPDAGYAPYDGPPPDDWRVPAHNPAIAPAGSTVIINGVAYPGGGTVSGGYYYPPATTTTITVQPGQGGRLVR